MAFGFGMGGYGGISLGDGPHPSRFSRRNKHRPSSNAESNIYPHAYPPKPVSEYVKEAAERAWLLPQYSWQNPGSPVSVHQLLYADPWQPDLAQPPLGYKKGDTGSTDYFAQCWRFNDKKEGKGFLEKLSAPIAPEGFNLFLVVSGVTWRFFEQNCCSTSLIARVEGINKDESHERFIMNIAGKLLSDVEAWLKPA
jgi:hypothetical protein